MDIRLEQLTIGYGRGRVVAKGIHATIAEERLTCLIGDNGIGKSTLLRTLSGFLPPMGGKVWLGDRELNGLSQHERARRVSIVLTQRPDAEGLTAHDLVGMGRSPYTGFWGNLSAQDEAVVAQSLLAAGAERLADRRLATLSDGECQKVMIARALAQETPVILLDEPTAFLDFNSRIATLQLLARLAHTRGKTILLSTHDLELATELADTLLLLTSDGLRTVDSTTIRKDISQRLHPDKNHPKDSF